MIAASDLALLAGLGGLLSLDRAAFLQSMASRPLVASTLAGYVVGNPQLGLLCGCLLELLWLMELPVGASIPPDDTLAALLAVPFAVCAPLSWPAGARAGLGVVASLPFGYLGRRLDVEIRHRNSLLLAKAREATARGGSLSLPHLAGGGVFFAAGAANAAVGALVGCLALELLEPVLASSAGRPFGLIGAGLSVVGVSAVLSGLRFKRARVLFSVGFGGGFLLGWALRPLLTASRGLWRP